MIKLGYDMISTCGFTKDSLNVVVLNSMDQLIVFMVIMAKKKNRGKYYHEKPHFVFLSGIKFSHCVARKSAVVPGHDASIVFEFLCMLTSQTTAIYIYIYIGCWYHPGCR